MNLEPPIHKRQDSGFLTRTYITLCMQFSFISPGFMLRQSGWKDIRWRIMSKYMQGCDLGFSKICAVDLIEKTYRALKLIF